MLTSEPITAATLSAPLFINEGCIDMFCYRGSHCRNKLHLHKTPLKQQIFYFFISWYPNWQWSNRAAARQKVAHLQGFIIYDCHFLTWNPLNKPVTFSVLNGCRFMHSLKKVECIIHSCAHYMGIHLGRQKKTSPLHRPPTCVQWRPFNTSFRVLFSLKWILLDPWLQYVG